MIKSGLLALVSSVQDYFTAHGVTANVVVGWKQPTEQINQGPGGANRVVFIPSDPGGRGGPISAAEQPGKRQFVGTGTAARPLVTWERFVIVSVWAVDGAQPQNEAAQIEAVETLFEWTVRAVQAFAKNNARWGDTAWTTSPVEAIFGRELRAGMTFKHPLFDVEVDVATPGFAITKELEEP